MPNIESRVTILDIAEKANVSPAPFPCLRNSAGVAQRNETPYTGCELGLVGPNIFAHSASGQSMTIMF